MGGGPGVRSRGAGTNPGEGVQGPEEDQGGTLRRRLPGLAPALLLLLLHQGCAGGPRPVTREVDAGDGVRVLFRVESESPSGRSRFRMAAALRPPASARLEFLGPVGGIRLVVATDGENATAILPPERQFDIAAGTPPSMQRLLGLPLDGSRLIALLSGAPMCPPESIRPGTASRPPFPEGRGLVVTCTPGDIVFSGVGGEPGQPLRTAALSDGGSGAIIAEVEYGDLLAGPDGPWPRDIRVKLPSTDVTIALTILDGPAAARLADTLFAPIIPDGFEHRPIFAQAGDPALYGVGHDTGP